MILLFEIAEKKSELFLMVLTRCSFIVERLWKKILFSQFSSVHSFPLTLDLKHAICDLFCQPLLSALLSLSVRVDQKANVGDLPFGFHLAHMRYGAASFFQFLEQVTKVEILGGTSHLCIEHAGLGWPKQFRADLSMSFWMT